MWVSETKFVKPQATKIVEDMRQTLAKSFGITVVGDTVTLRWYMDEKKEKLIQVTMKIINIDNGEY